MKIEKNKYILATRVGRGAKGEGKVACWGEMMMSLYMRR